MRRGELDSRLLILVTLALVAFGLVMVYSATSAAAAKEKHSSSASRVALAAFIAANRLSITLPVPPVPD